MELAIDMPQKGVLLDVSHASSVQQGPQQHGIANGCNPEQSSNWFVVHDPDEL